MFSFKTIKTTILLGALTALLVAVGGLLGGSYGMVLGFAMAIAMNFGSYWFSDKIALKMAGAKEVPYAEATELHDVVATLARDAGLSKPRVAIIGFHESRSMFRKQLFWISSQDRTEEINHGHRR